MPTHLYLSAIKQLEALRRSNVETRSASAALILGSIGCAKTYLSIEECYEAGFAAGALLKDVATVKDLYTKLVYEQMGYAEADCFIVGVVAGYLTPRSGMLTGEETNVLRSLIKLDRPRVRKALRLINARSIEPAPKRLRLKRTEQK